MSLMHWIISTVAILAGAYLIPGVDVTLIGAFVLAIVLGLLNVFIKPIISILTLPLNIITLGLFSLVVNAGLILLAGMIVPGFAVNGFLNALIFSIVISLINALFSGLAKN
jgi:putative membrane protein